MEMRGVFLSSWVDGSVDFPLTVPQAKRNCGVEDYVISVLDSAHGNGNSGTCKNNKAGEESGKSQ